MEAQTLATKVFKIEQDDPYFKDKYSSLPCIYGDCLSKNLPVHNFPSFYVTNYPKSCEGNVCLQFVDIDKAESKDSKVIVTQQCNNYVPPDPPTPPTPTPDSNIWAYVAVGAGILLILIVLIIIIVNAFKS